MSAASAKASASEDCAADCTSTPHIIPHSSLKSDTDLRVQDLRTLLMREQLTMRHDLLGYLKANIYQRHIFKSTKTQPAELKG